MKISMEIREEGMIAMVTDEKTIPLDLIIHPGETLAEVLEERGITCAELEPV